jgi:hypothetical protein
VLTDDRIDHIRGAAETLQWSRDAEAGEMMLDLLAEIDELRRTIRAAITLDELRDATKRAEKAEARLNEVRSDTYLAAAIVIDAFRDTKPKPRAAEPAFAMPPGDRAHYEYMRGVETGERTALYSAVCRLEAMAVAAARG